MYEKYTTNALVLKSEERGEYDRIFALYTRDFGLVYARASAVRRTNSKMRSALSLFAPASVSLVRGTRGWRLAGARAVEHEMLLPEGVHAYARIVHLLLRLVHGEEAHHYLFEVLQGARDGCVQQRGVSLAAVELLSVARMLYALGYISTEALSTAFFAHTQFAHTDLEAIHEGKKEVLQVVNKAIAESQL